MTPTTIVNIGGVQHRPCPGCERTLPLTVEFWARARSTKGGFQGVCKDCRYSRYAEPKLSGRAARRRGVVYADSLTHKQCRRCGEVKQRSEFAQRVATRDGHFPWCRECDARYKAEEQANRSPCDELKRRLARLGLTVERYEELLAEQDGVCAVCRLPNRQIDSQTGRPRRFHVDHDHSCCPGQKSCGDCIRGLLCAHCNVALGMADDDPARLRALADYLER